MLDSGVFRRDELVHLFSLGLQTLYSFGPVGRQFNVGFVRFFGLGSGFALVIERAAEDVARHFEASDLGFFLLDTGALLRDEPVRRFGLRFEALCLFGPSLALVVESCLVFFESGSEGQKFGFILQNSGVFLFDELAQIFQPRLGGGAYVCEP